MWKILVCLQVLAAHGATVDEFAHLDITANNESLSLGGKLSAINPRVFFSSYFAQAKALINPKDHHKYDEFTCVHTLVHADNLAAWEQPKAKDVKRPKNIKAPKTVPCGLAKDRLVPEWDLSFTMPPKVFNQASYAMNYRTPFPKKADDCGKFKKPSIGEALHRTRMWNNALNLDRVLVPWGKGKYSDQAISDMVFFGFGQHRIMTIRKGDHNAPADARYAVYTLFLADLEHKPGYAKLGADGYFDKDGKLIAIFRGGKLHQPGSLIETKEWKFAKMAFRGSLHGLVTLADHLFLLHLVTANGLVRATTEALDADHPLRRLLTPFGFRTSAINYAAAVILVPENGQIHRAAPFTKGGLLGLFEYAEKYFTKHHWSNAIPSQFKNQGINITLPLHEDGLEYSGYIQEMVGEYVDLHLKDDCSSMEEWYNRLDEIALTSLARPFSCDSVKQVISTYVFMVTAFHTHVGALMSESIDPCFCPWSFREGELCGMPRPTETQLLIYAATAREQPRIYEDFTHMFDDEQSKQIWHKFTAKIMQLQHHVDERNSKRRRIYRGLDPRVMECSVGI